MNNILSNTLRQLGCHDRHVKLYKAAMDLGKAPLSDIAHRARMNRSTAYYLVAELMQMGLMQEDHRTYRKQFSVVSPDALLRKLDTQYRKLGRQKMALKDALPELQAAHQATTVRPRVRTYEGKSGLYDVWKDILRDKQEVLLWSNQATERKIFDTEAHEKFIRERIAKTIPVRVLAVDNAEGRDLPPCDVDTLRQTKVLPAKTTFTSETYIYGNKVAVLDVSHDIFGVITENKQVARSQRAMFELVWSQLE